MASIEPVSDDTTAAPFALRIGLGLIVGLLAGGAVYLYAVRGTAMIFDLANGLGGMLCL